MPVSLRRKRVTGEQRNRRRSRPAVPASCPAWRGPSFHRRSDRRGSGGHRVDDGGRPGVGRGCRGRRRDRGTWPARARPDPRTGGVRAQARCAAGLDASSRAPSPQPGACSAPSQSAVATVTAACRARKGSSSCPSARSWCAGSRIPGESGRGGRGLPRHEVGDSPPRLLPTLACGGLASPGRRGCWQDRLYRPTFCNARIPREPSGRYRMLPGSRNSVSGWSGRAAYSDTADLTRRVSRHSQKASP